MGRPPVRQYWPRQSGAGLYEITGQREQDKRTRLFDGHEWLAGPFYDLQWCLSRLRGDDLYAILKPDGMLLLPEPERWPFLYERALVLCSGRLPSRFQDSDQYYLGYKGVGRSRDGLLRKTWNQTEAGAQAMKDLAGMYARLDEAYRLYVESAFPLRDKALADDRRLLLSSGTLLSQPPLLEPVPTYMSSGLDIAAAAKQLGPEYAGLAHLGAPLMGDRPLYTHQLKSLEESISKKKDIVVTTGTGSGKTECFLLPLLAELARDSAAWPASPEPPDGRAWWKSGSSKFSGQWEHTGRAREGSHALRAMVLYPERTRRGPAEATAGHIGRPGKLGLDGRERGATGSSSDGTTGLTPVSGSNADKGAIERLAKHLRQVEKEFAKAYRPRKKATRTCATTSRTRGAARCGRAGTCKKRPPT